MEKRSIVLSALILALVLVGGLFYTLGQNLNLNPNNLAASLTEADGTGDEIEEVGTEETVSPEVDGQADSTAPPRLAQLPTASPTLSPAAATPSSATADTADPAETAEQPQDVIPSAATGPGPVAALSASLSVVLGVLGFLTLLPSRRR